MTDRKKHITAAFRGCVEVGEYLKNIEFHLGLQPEKPRDLDIDAIQVQILDLRGALGSTALELAHLAEIESEMRSLEDMIADIDARKL